VGAERRRRRGALLAVVALGALVAGAGRAAAQPTAVTGALLPTSRSVQVGAPATAFASLINTGGVTALQCGLELGTPINAAFEYRTTDPATNLPITPAQTRVDIPPGGLQTWVFGITPNAPLAPTEVVVRMDCDNTDPAPVFPGVNTILLSATATPGPDLVALAATLASDGVVRAPGYRGTGVFAVAISNVGAAGAVVAAPELAGTTGGAVATICETDVAGACLAPPAGSVPAAVAAGSARSFGVFVQGNGPAPFDPAHTRVNVLFRVAGVVRGATGVAYETQTQLAGDGGTLQFEATTLLLEPNSAWAPVSFAAAIEAAPPHPLPAGFAPERTRTVTVSDETRLNAPVKMFLDYDPAATGGGAPFVMHYDAAAGRYEPVTQLGTDTAGHRVLVDSRVFSSFVAAIATNLALPASYTVPGFDPAAHSWNVVNFGSYFSPGGNCLGMSAYAVWFFENRPGQQLVSKYSTAGGEPISIAHLTATRAHLAQSRFWSNLQGLPLTPLDTDVEIAARMKLALQRFNRPLVFMLGDGSLVGHASVVYGWDPTGFLIYEVNTAPGQPRTAVVPFGGVFFGAYDGWTSFNFLGTPSLGRNEDFGDLTAEAEAGFVGSTDIALTSPTQGQQVHDRKVDLTGSLTGPLASGRDVVAYVNGQETPIGDDISSFDREVPVKFGDNTLIVLAGDIGIGSLWHKNSATLVRQFEGTLPPATFRATLTWNKSGDVDLYVTEPGGETSWYGDHATSNGLALDFDNVSGFGPENVTLSVGEGDTVLPGIYSVRVHFYRGTGPVSGTVQILTYEGAPKQKNRTINWAVSANGSSATDGPGGTGPQWDDVADVDVVNNVITPR
jgi:uncharacterized protein YfaP (DUF2135 family)